VELKGNQLIALFGAGKGTVKSYGLQSQSLASKTPAGHIARAVSVKHLENLDAERLSVKGWIPLFYWHAVANR
jgi:hypothetical protein